RVGINLGAPGDRVAPNGTLWLDYPSRGGPSPKLPVSIKPENPEWFCHHSSLLESGELKWVAASGVKGIGKITVILAEKPGKARPYTVRLYFAETCYAPQQKSLAPRVFDLALQGQNVLKGFDILTQAGGPNRTVVKEFKNILVNRDLTLTFNSSSTINTNKPSICGIEIIAESW
ncbi:MAG: malectin domain-containing carbohydrate-binding protein, partial [Gemmatimonadota bacterium]|nr:malectin domain-containing carbohydrate-binding protein [Gemmatimonadota bacterium]